MSFDINEVDWSIDSNIDYADCGPQSELCIDFNMPVTHVYFSIFDVIAMAKYYELSDEDLK